MGALHGVIIKQVCPILATAASKEPLQSCTPACSSTTQQSNQKKIGSVLPSARCASTNVRMPATTSANLKRGDSQQQAQTQQEPGSTRSTLNFHAWLKKTFAMPLPLCPSFSSRSEKLNVPSGGASCFSPGSRFWYVAW